jgi:hypothetical protein
LRESVLERKRRAGTPAELERQWSALFQGGFQLDDRCFIDGLERLELDLMRGDRDHSQRVQADRGLHRAACCPSPPCDASSAELQRRRCRER